MYMDLMKAYEKRLEHYDLSNLSNLEKVCLGSEKDGYFALLYFWMTNRDLLEYYLYSSPIVRLSINMLCEQVRNESLHQYYKQYLDIYESSTQIAKIVKEFDFSNNVKLGGSK